jgi:hypothetical protein
VANYDVYVSTNGVDYAVWLLNTVETSAWFVSELGQSYHFHAVARDFVGNEQERPAAPQAQTTVAAEAPVLAVLSNLTISAGQPLTLSNRVHGVSVGPLVFTFGQGMPYGASVNPTNGVFKWTPTCGQGSTTNLITVWLTDTGRGGMMDAMNFTITVGKCVQPTLGRLVMQCGDTGRLPIHLVSSVRLTNLDVTVGLPTDRLVNPLVAAFVPEICSATIAEGGRDGLPGRPSQSPNAAGPAVQPYLLSFATCSNQFLMGTQQVAWLQFTAVPDQPSAFVTVQLGESVGTQPDGAPVTNYTAQAGRVVVVCEQPLLEAFVSTNGQPALMLYAQSGTTNVLETTTSLAACRT